MPPIPRQYRPIQFNSGLHYEELPPSPALAPLLLCFWAIRNDSPHWQDYHIIPDGTVDLVAGLYGDWRLKASFSQHTAAQLPLPPGAQLWGLRLYPAAFSSLFGLPMQGLGQYYWLDLDALIGPAAVGSLAERLAEAPSLAQKRPLMEAFLLARWPRRGLPGDGRFFQALHDIYDRQGHLPIGQQKDWGISPRQLRRLFDTYLGFSPKRFAQIVQVQHAIKGLRQPGFSFFEAGFYDQAHFIHQIKRHTGLTPGEVAALWQAAAPF